MDGGFEEGSELGPVISPHSKERIEKLIASAEKEGASILLDGRGQKPLSSKYPNGNWVGPTVISDVTTDMTCYTEEIFGPVVNINVFKSEDEVLTKANATEFVSPSLAWPS